MSLSKLECIDRMYRNVYIPALQCEAGVAKFFRSRRGHPFASSALMDPMTKSFVAAMERHAKQEGIPLVQFHKGERKDKVMASTWLASTNPWCGDARLNGHEYAKCQLRREGIGFKELDNRFVSCEDPRRLQAICEELGPPQIDGLLRRWLARLPYPFTAQDREAG